MSAFTFDLAYATAMDQKDPLRHFRDRFFFPQHQGKDTIYFTGNSLGLQPKSVRDHINIELEDWAKLGVEGHFKARHPWMHYHKRFSEQAAQIVGALPHEVVMMNTLTVNLHLLMVSFYRPDARRFKIIVEGQLFPSDHYVVESQLQFHGFDPAEGLIELMPRPGEHTLSTADILAAIEEAGDELALVMLGGVNYYTGQWFDMPAITQQGHAVGAMVGFDCAHAAGNVPLHLHDWEVDFAAWCTYKYLNSGPGSVGGIFIHDKHLHRNDLPRFNGWWGYQEETRFKMEKGFVPMEGAAAWQNSNAPVFNMVAHKAALDIFEEAGMAALRKKSLQLTAYMAFCLEEINRTTALPLQVITPDDPNQRGCQLSILTGDEGEALFQHLSTHGVVADWRHPNVIRVAPVPLYNSFEEVYRFAQLLKDAAQ